MGREDKSSTLENIIAWILGIGIIYLAVFSFRSCTAHQDEEQTIQEDATNITAEQAQQINKNFAPISYTTHCNPEKIFSEVLKRNATYTFWFSGIGENGNAYIVTESLNKEETAFAVLSIFFNKKGTYFSVLLHFPEIQDIREEVEKEYGTVTIDKQNVNFEYVVMKREYINEVRIRRFFTPGGILDLMRKGHSISFSLPTINVDANFSLYGFTAAAIHAASALNLEEKSKEKDRKREDLEKEIQDAINSASS